MIDLVAVHRAHKTKIVHDACGVGEQIADPHAGLASRTAAEVRGQTRFVLLVGSHGGEPQSTDDAVGDILTAPLDQLGLVVEEIHVRRTAGLHHVDDALGFRGEMREPGESESTRGGGRGRTQCRLAEERVERGQA